MSKELSPLQALKEIEQYNFGGIKDFSKHIAIIKTALKDVKRYKTIYPLMKAKLDKVSDDKLKLQNVLEIIKSPDFSLEFDESQNE